MLQLSWDNQLRSKLVLQSRQKGRHPRVRQERSLREAGDDDRPIAGRDRPRLLVELQGPDVHLDRRIPGLLLQLDEPVQRSNDESHRQRPRRRVSRYAPRLRNSLRSAVA